MEWELNKENIQPLRKGRKNFELLNEGLKAKSHAPTMEHLIQQRRAHLEGIDTYTGPDPLGEWLKCIQWTREAFPSGGAQSGILPMIETCLRSFWHDPRYKDDERYLKLWIDYAHKTDRPADVFEFISVNDIGQSFAVYYEAYAEHLERVKNFNKARDMYDLGIAREAQPLEELRRMYKNFITRSLAHPNMKDEEEDHDEGFVRSFGAQRGTQAGTVRHQQKTPRQERVQPRQSIQTLSTQTFSIFVDSEFSLGARTNKHHEDQQWHNLGTQAERSKENVQQPSKWKQAKIPQRHTKPFVIEPTLPVFVDEKFRSEVNPRSATRKASSSAVEARLSRVEDMNADTQMLKQNPLRNFPKNLR